MRWTASLAAVACLSSFAFMPVVWAQAELANDAVDAIGGVVEGVLNENGAPGCSVSAVWGGQLVWAQGYGIIDIESRKAAAPESIYRFGSVSKMITAAGAMKLVDERRLVLDEPVRTYCPAFPAHDMPITVHHLLAHQSGIRHWRTSSERFNRTVYPTIESTFSVFAADPLLFAPGTEVEYSTPAYNVVGCAMEGASGLDFRTFMQREVFQPAGMTTAYVGDAPAENPLRSTGYRIGPRGPALARPDDLSIKLPGGGLSGSVLDLAHFAIALYDGSLISADSRSDMWTAKTTSDGVTTEQGYGCSMGDEKGRHVVWKIGGVAGFCGILYLYPDEKAAVALLFNLETQPVFPTASAIMDAVIAGERGD